MLMWREGRIEGRGGWGADSRGGTAPRAFRLESGIGWNGWCRFRGLWLAASETWREALRAGGENQPLEGERAGAPVLSLCGCDFYEAGEV